MRMRKKSLKDKKKKKIQIKKKTCDGSLFILFV